MTEVKRPTRIRHLPSASKRGSKNDRFTLFSQMSKEALQAIDETRKELGEGRTQECDKQETSAVRQGNVDPLGDVKRQTEALDEDKDSAIGTDMRTNSSKVCSPVSDAVTKREVLEEQQKQDTELLKPQPSMEATITTPPTQTFKELQTKRPQATATSGQNYERISTTIRENALNPPKLHPALSKNVFERLSTTEKPIYRITARQRSKARLSLSMTNKAPLLYKCMDNKSPKVRTELPSLSKHNVDNSSQTKRPLTRPTTAKLNSKHYKHTHKERDDSLLGLQPHRPRTSMETREQSRSIYVPPLVVPENNSPFEITPTGYDSRYTSRHGGEVPQPYSDDEELQEIINQAKQKCTQWLIKQLALLSNT